MAKDSNKKQVEQITDMEVDFAQWYTDVCRKAELIDYSSIKGLCQMVHRYRKESGADGLFQRAGLHDYRALWLGHLGKYPGYFRP